ncbi:MAG: DEAD/DEAH box helicase [Deltaproteobacteria bacterium]|nr:DEAD/DEAH box helicase [Deltaproteobacteria bacterium]
MAARRSSRSRQPSPHPAPPTEAAADDPLGFAHEPTRAWFRESFASPTRAQQLGWPAIASGASTLLLAPTGSGKTLAAFLVALDRLLFADPRPADVRGCKVVYLSPLRALGVDVERNLRAPLAGLRTQAARMGAAARSIRVAIRTGDTPAGERRDMLREPPDVLITTPESLFLLLTSKSAAMLATVDTVIVDEIHAMVGSKRGAHLALSLERLEALREDATRPLQRIGLSATQRPLAEVARFLGGGTVAAGAEAPWQPRTVEIIDASEPKVLDLSVELPASVADEGGPTAATERDPLGGKPPRAADRLPSGPAAAAPALRSVWPAIHPRLLELIRAHRSTLLFVNSRRLAERLANALNELAGDEIARAHHGSLAREQRLEIEERLKAGALPALVATSSLELGIDMGAIDLVIQIEAPPSVAAGLQRVGRAGHGVGAVSKGAIFPKYRSDLLACAAVTARMDEARVEETFYPRNPLDVLAQQIVGIVARAPVTVERLHRWVRGAAPFAELSRGVLEGVLDMLAGRYPSDEFAELRPRINWDRVSGTLTAREGAARLVVLNAGTIPDRGLYGVFLQDEKGGPGRRVGELDEEMVFETRLGDVFVLGASSWRVEEITPSQVLVSPAPGEPGKMPFWRGEGLGRSPELGAAIGALSRELARLPPADAKRLLEDRHHLEAGSAALLVDYLGEQAQATGEVPSDRTIVVEHFRDEIGDWRVCVLSPFGARVHAPWATAVAERLRDAVVGEVDVMWSDDGMVFRLPESGEVPPVDWLFPAPEEIEDLVVRNLAGTSLFAGRFRECAGRALLFPKRYPGQRTALWQQRRKAQDLLGVAVRHPGFPILLETYRECLRDVFDLPALTRLLAEVRSRAIHVRVVESERASPFASSLVFSWVANFVYEGDAPLAERRAQALTVDTAQLRELLGEAELREILDAAEIEAHERRLQRLEPRAHVPHADALHDLMRALGDLSRDELVARADAAEASLDAWLERLRRERRAALVSVAGEKRFIAVEDTGRYRDALGVVPPRGTPVVFLESNADPLAELVARYARTHGPFVADEVAARLGTGRAPVLQALARLAVAGRVLEGGFSPGRRETEWCDAEVLRALKRRALARLRREIEPVPQAALARWLAEWQGVVRPRVGLDALLTVIEQLQGAAIPASILESEVLPARVRNYTPAMLDELCLAGEVVWRGVEASGPFDGRIALYLTDRAAELVRTPAPLEGELHDRIRAVLRERGAMFFADLARELGGFPNDLADALWDLVWNGEVANDTLAPLRSRLASGAREATKRRARERFRSRRVGPPGTEGRFSLAERLAVSALASGAAPSATVRRTALARQLLERNGVVTREAVAAEGLPGGYAGLYPVLRAMEEAGRVRRGYFVEGLGATQFALPGLEDRLRALRAVSEPGAVRALAACDPANPYGVILEWPKGAAAARPQRVAGAHVVMIDGALRAWLGRTARNLLTYLPDDEAERAEVMCWLAEGLGAAVDAGTIAPLHLAEIDGEPAGEHRLAHPLRVSGFEATRTGLVRRRRAPDDDADADEKSGPRDARG